MIHKRNWIKEGMDVADKNQLDVKMTVSRILRQTRKVRKLEGDNITTTEESQIIGIECLLWQDGKLLTPRYHTRQLIPWDIAVEAADKGYHVVEKFNKEINK